MLVTPDVSRNLSTWPSPLREDQALARIHAAQQRLANGEGVDLAIVDGSNDILMGWIGLVRTTGSTAQLGYWLGTQFRGQGFAKEAVGAVLPFGARLLRTNEVRAFVHMDNLVSISVLEANGFERDGAERIFWEVRGDFEPCIWFRRDVDP